MHKPSPKKTPPPLRLPGDHLAIPPDANKLCMVFTQSELRSGAVGRGVDDLMEVSDSGVLSRQLAHGLLIWFKGYKQPNNELPMVPELRLYMQSIHAQWPYWMHFLTPMPEMWALVLLSLLKSTKLEQRDGQHVGYHFDKVECTDLLASMTLAMNNLHDHIGISDDESERIFNGSMRAIEACMEMPGGVFNG